MGMFSTVVHDGREIQFKTGWDDCFTYKVGDKIDWKPDPFYPGEHIDGIHSGCYDLDAPDVNVVIKGCVIVAIEPHCRSREYLETKYGITKPDHKLWTKEQWKAKADREAKAEADYQAWAKVNGDNPLGYYMHMKLKERSIIDQVLPARKV